jgi:ABC-type multidrug transport system fused ATPase/permease subunit
MEVLGMLAGSAALLVGVHWVTNANMQSSSFFTLLILLGTTAESVRKSSDIWNKVQKSDAAAERVFAVIDRPVEFEKPGAVELPPLREKVEFRDVVFTYPGNDQPTLNRVNLTVQVGRNIALVGPNGSGKTTLVNLIPRFYNVDSGSVLIDGLDIRDCTLKSLRNQIGMVTQNVVTFNDTIAANIAYGKPDAGREAIIAAAKRSFAHEFVDPLPDGYDTVIGEQGAGLSGGQLQRIVIARAVLKNPAILIFDEATSQVDANSEAKIHRAIEEIMQDRTTFIIAHRFSTVITADLIVVMDEGRIVACGQHEELMQTCSLYQSLYETQLVASK